MAMSAVVCTEERHSEEKIKKNYSQIDRHNVRLKTENTTNKSAKISYCNKINILDYF